MARKLTDEEAKGIELKAVGQRKYNWDEWTDGGTYELVHGEDFTVPIYNFRTQLYQVAKRKNLTVSAHQTEGKLTVRFTPKPANTVEPPEAFMKPGEFAVEPQGRRR